MKLSLKMFFKKELIPLYLIILAGAFLRIRTLLTLSFAFTYDVGRDMIAVSQIANLEKISLIGPTTGLQGVFYGPWWYLLLTPFFIISTGDPVGIGFVMFLAGVATVVLSYIVGKKINGNYLGLCFAAITAFSPHLIFTSSQIWSPNLAPFFTILIVLCLYSISTAKKTKFLNFLFLGLLLGLTIDMGIVYGCILLIGVSISLAFQKKLNVKSILFYILGLVIIFSPRIIFELKHNFLMTRSLVGFFGKDEVSRSFIDYLSGRANFFSNELSHALGGHIQLAGVLFACFAILTLILLRKSLQKEEKTFVTTSFIIILTFFLATVLFRHDLYTHYFAGLAVFLILPLAIALNLIAKKFGMYISVAILFLILLVNLNPIEFINSLKEDSFTGNASVYRNQLAVIDYVYGEAGGKEFKYVVYTPPVFDYPYRYLFNWYGKKKYGYTARQQPDLAFFVLEPDHEAPERLTYWLKVRRKDGKIIKTKKFDSGIIVQTRVN